VKSDTKEQGNSFDNYLYYKWQIAICYHPMYMIQDEDQGVPALPERTPPWGCDSAEEYLERVKRNLTSLEEDPELTLNYEWSIHALADIAERFPDVHKRMRSAAERGQLCFLGGEYSLAHTHTFSSEAAWRQFEYGTQLFRELYGQDITVHAHQEVHVFRQLPQLLKEFGFEFLVLPAFPWGLTITSGEFDLLGYERAYHLKKGDDCITIEALDGTGIPGLFTTNVRLTRPVIHMGRGPWSAPPVFIDFPDLEEYHNPMEGKAQSVLLDKAAAERFEAAPPRATGQIYSYYSYCEGIWAEAHQRASKGAEDHAIQAGNLLAMSRLKACSPGLQDELDSMWRTILKYQDHEATWINVSFLRQKAIDLFAESEQAAGDMMATAGKAMVSPDENTVSVFNGLTRGRTVPLQLEDNEALPGSGTEMQRVGDKIVGVLELPSLGSRSFEVAAAAPSPSMSAALPSQFKTQDYDVELTENGLIQSITTATGEAVLRADAYLGGEMRCVIDDRWVDNRQATVEFLDGPVCSIVQRDSRIGTIPVKESYQFFKTQPLIKCSVELDFNDDRVGDFHIEESKLNIYLPTPGKTVYGDTQFAVEEFKNEEQIIAQNWVYSGGLIHVNRGTPKYWFRDGLIANTIAYGGDDWTNRIHPDNWNKRNKDYPQFLNGKQTIEYWLIPFGSYDAAGVVKRVEDAVAPVTILSGRADFSLGEITAPGLVVTALYERGEEVMARGVQLPTESAMRFRAWEIFNIPLRELLGH